MSSEINKIASKYDNKHTMFFLWVCLLSGLTLGILPLVWIHKFCNRIDAEMTRRGIEHNFSSNTWWGWGFFGSLIIVGPFIFMYRLFKNFNALCADYNEKGE